MSELSTPYLDRAGWLVAARRVEDDYPLADGRRLRIRELSAEERMAAQEVGDPDPETRVFRNIPGMYAYIVACGVIDPATRTPLFAADDLAALIATPERAARLGLDIRSLGSAIWRLSEADADSFRGVGDAPDQPGDADPDVRAPAGAGAAAADGA